MKRDKKFIVLFGFTVFFFMSGLFFMKRAFLAGDNYVQFYPWFKCYSQAIKSFSFPYWVSSIGSGFPLMSEGQVGGFYPLNMAAFFLLPFEIAYNYSVILHFILGGVFIYMYTRKLGADEIGGYVSALLFCFGSAYAGSFCTIVTLRTLAWFPLVLLLMERRLSGKREGYIVLAGLVMGLQLLAGSVQMAAYCAIFYLIYYTYRSTLLKKSITSMLVSISIFLATAFIIALPQLMLSYELSGFSNREHTELGFALWGSFLPTSFFGLVFPNSFSNNSNFYIGILGILFAIHGFYQLRKQPILKAMVLILAISVFFGLGAFNPIYVFILRIAKFYIFRNPSKFLFFGMFSLSVLAGCGFSAFFGNTGAKEKARSARVFYYILSASSLFFILGKSLLCFFKRSIIEAGNYYVSHFVYNTPHHRQSLEYYLNSVLSTYEILRAKFSLSNFFTISSWLMIAAALVIIPTMAKKRLKYAAIALIFIDLFIFSFYGIGFGGNTKPFSAIEPDHPGILKNLRADDGIYRILPLDVRSGALPNWSIPNTSMIFGIDSIACYSPLSSKSYKDALSGIEVVDDSLGLKPSDDTSVYDKSPLLSLLNVKYIVSHKALSRDSLDLVDTEGGVFLYKRNDYFPRVFFSCDIGEDVRPARSGQLKILALKDGSIDLEVSSDRAGFVVFSENYYPGWHVYVDGKESHMTKVHGLLQAVAIGKGGHRVNFVYKPYSSIFKR